MGHSFRVCQVLLGGLHHRVAEATFVPYYRESTRVGAQS